jgi:phosphoglycolate phosphatase
MKYKLVVFDFDGTLADSFPWAVSVQNHLAEKYRLPVLGPAEYERLRSFDTQTILKQTGVSPWRLPGMVRYVHRLMNAQLDQIRLFPGIDRLLPKLVNQGATLAVVSSNSRVNVRRVLGPANTGCIRYFECGVSLFGKAPKLRKVLRQSEVRPREAILIGDEIRDLQAAQAVHMAVGAVAWGYNHAAALRAQAPDFMFTRVDEILEQLT